VPALLAALPLAGRLVTGDALYCQRALCRQIVQADGDYLLIVKANQPALAHAIATLFVHPPPGERFATAITWDKHGDRVETRRLWASAALSGYLDWPGLQQVALVERVCRRRGVRTRQVRAVITSLGPATPAATLLAQVRGHWAIENRLHWVRDVTLGEDASQVRRGAAPQVLATLRNCVIALLRHAGATNLAAALRHGAWCPGAALTLLGLVPP
jgi:predicted transposase YbfD/YdcC